MLSRRLSTKYIRFQNLQTQLRTPKLRYFASAASTTKEASSRPQNPVFTGDLHTFRLEERIHGFQVREIQDVKEFRIRAINFVHEKTKAEYLHLYRDDTNNVFSINFRTTPRNSTGLPHILEHTVLCGSEMFPVRDPFFKMLNRSLATFMNAMTGSDYTMYPFSTQNYTDFKNLQKIYLDAVFRPKLMELDFMQEGWRFENVDINNIKSELIIKGVVYNEMKGVFSEKENILGQKLQNLILPDHTYGVISGGDPMEIPNLTWEDLKKFHADHYHPSNARFFSYGNFPVLPSLDYINSNYLSNYEFLAPRHTEVPKQKRWSEPRKNHITCRFDNMGEPVEKQNTVSVSLLLSDNTDPYETLLMQFVTDLLIKGSNAPFYETLIEPNFSGGFTPSTGFDMQPRDCIFTVGLQGVKKEDFERMVNIFDSTIDKVIKEGFKSQHIESVLHNYELSIKHESKNFGLNLLFGVTPTWNHTTKVIDALRMSRLLEKLKIEMDMNGHYLQQIVKKYFKDNKHRLVLTMSPDKDYEIKLDAMEKDMIKKKVKKLSDSDKKEIFVKCQELQKLQQLIQTTELLPTLQVEDISSEIERVEKIKITVNTVQTQINKVNTNGIVYFKGLLNTNELSPEQQMLLPLFCYVINKLGTDSMNYRDFDSLTNRKTAGLNLANHVAESLYHLHSYEPAVYVSSYCLEKNVEDMWNLWLQIFKISQLKDVERFKMLVQLYMANLTHGIIDSGHIYAMQAAASLISGTSYQVELLSGLYHISYMKRLVHTSNYPAMLAELLNIAKILFDKKKFRVALNIAHDNQSPVLHNYDKFVSELPANPKTVSAVENSYVTGKVWAPTDAVNCQHHVLNVPVNFCSKAVLTAPYTHADYANLRVLAKLLTSKYLHPELREKQGAYGGGVRLTNDGVFSFYSYRDPRSAETLDVFDGAYEWLQVNLDTLSGQDVLEAKLGVFQAIDTPIPPSSKGNDEFLRRLTPDIIQRHRADVMKVDKEGLKTVADKYLSQQNALHTGKVVLGPKNEKMDVKKRGGELWTVLDSA